MSAPRLTLIPFSFVLATAVQAAPTTAQPAKPQTTNPQSPNPQVVALFDSSIAAYAKLNTLRVRTRMEMTNPKGQKLAQIENWEWKRPFFARSEMRMGEAPHMLLGTRISNESELYDGGPASQPDATRDPIFSPALTGLPNIGSESVSRNLLVGRNPFRLPQASQSGETLTLLPPAVQAGVRYKGVRSVLIRQGVTITRETWFDAKTHLLHATIQKVSAPSGESASSKVTLESVEINPKLAPARFVLPTVVVSPAQHSAQDEIYWDPKLKVGDAPPPIAGPNLKGATQDLAKLKGRVVLVDFWATWCGPCVQAMPRVQQLRRKYQAQGFEVLGVSCDTNKVALAEFTRQFQIDWAQIYEGKEMQGTIPKSLGVQGIPFTLLIGRDGKIAAINPHGPAMETAIKAAL